MVGEIINKMIDAEYGENFSRGYYEGYKEILKTTLHLIGSGKSPNEILEILETLKESPRKTHDANSSSSIE